MRQVAWDMTGLRIMARPVVPIRVRWSVVRVDVARTIVTTIVHVATTANGTHRVRIDEVGVKERILHQLYCNPKLKTV